MTAIESLQKAMLAAAAILLSAGLVEGESLDPDEIPKRDSVIFWPFRCEDPAATKKETFCVYKVQGLDPTVRGDDRSDRSATVYIDFWTLLPITDKRLGKTIKKVEEKFTEAGWSIELGASPYYDSSSKRHQLTLSAEKPIE